jgi:ParB family transcriptional regulator, chromosome partitioning protein
MSKRKALGSGLEALLSAKPELSSNLTKKDNVDQSSSINIKSIPVHEISRNKNQPRQVFFDNALESMAASIKERGQLSPILVRKTQSGFELIAGERRWRAMQSIQEPYINAIVMDVDDKESALIAIVENVQREQLNSIEESEALLKLSNEYSMSHDDIAKYTGKSRSHVTNIMRLNDLTDFTKSKLIDGSIEMGHARAVLSLESTAQNSIISQAISQRLSVRAVEALVRGKKSSNPRQAQKKTQDTISLENQFSEHLAADVKIQHKNDGSGKIEIKYKSLDELQGIMNKFK